MKFFTDRKGATYPTSRVQRIAVPRQLEGSSVETARVELSDGDAVEVYPSTATEMSKSAQQIIPAEPGTYFLYAPDSPGESVHRSTIIGWALCSDGGVRGVTPSGVDDGWVSNAEVILLPNGRVHLPDETEYASEEEWLADRQKR